MLSACSQELLENDVETKKEVTAHFSFNTAPMIEVCNGAPQKVATKSTDVSSVDENLIADMWIVQFDDKGVFLKKQYFTTIVPDALDVPLVANVTGATSNIYFLVNIGASLSYAANEVDFTTRVRAVTDEASLFYASETGKKCIPMFGKLKNVTVPSSGFLDKPTITLTRMLAKLELTYNVTADFAVEGVKLCNIPNSMCFVTPAGVGSNPTTIFGVQNYPIETPADGKTGKLTFYVPENQRGYGENATTNERLKCGVAGATYFELSGHTVGATGGNRLLYAIYPGENNYNGYNVVRNTYYKVTTEIKDISVSDSRVKIAERSNCYLIKPGESVEISVQRANESHEIGVQIPDVTVANAWIPSVYWQTSANLITVDNTTVAKGYFKVTATNATTEGNAIVAVKDNSGKILWTFHIWVLSADMENASNQNSHNGYTFMDRNLGALKVATTSPLVNYGYTSGLYYQWGRKDPFMYGNSASSSIAALTLYDAAGATFTAPVPSDLTTSTVLYDLSSRLYDNTSLKGAEMALDIFRATKYPSLIFGDWYGSTATDKKMAKTGLDSWAGEPGQQKSIYDPCPIGWRVPSGKRTSYTYSSPWTTTFITAPGTSQVNGNAAKLTGGGVYPLAGLRYSSTGEIGSSGYNGSYWSATSYDADIVRANHLCITLFDNSVKDTYNAKSWAYSVRCVKNWN